MTSVTESPGHLGLCWAGSAERERLTPRGSKVLYGRGAGRASLWEQDVGPLDNSHG
jgi:hypothetical protein